MIDAAVLGCNTTASLKTPPGFLFLAVQEYIREHCEDRFCKAIWLACRAGPNLILWPFSATSRCAAAEISNAAENRVGAIFFADKSGIGKTGGQRGGNRRRRLF